MAKKFMMVECPCKRGQRFELMRNKLRKNGELDKRQSSPWKHDLTVDVDDKGRVRIYSGGVLAYERGYEEACRDYIVVARHADYEDNSRVVATFKPNETVYYSYNAHDGTVWQSRLDKATRLSRKAAREVVKAHNEKYANRQEDTWLRDVRVAEAEECEK